VERYKGYLERVALDLRPLTLLIGANSSGKSAIARAIALAAGALAPREGDEPLPLNSLGLVHGRDIHDLIWRRSTHGHVALTLKFVTATDDVIQLDTTVQAVVSHSRTPAVARVTRWSLREGSHHVTIDFDVTKDNEESHEVSIDGAAAEHLKVHWAGLVPSAPELSAATWMGDTLDGIRTWAAQVRYLRSPREMSPSPFRTGRENPLALGVAGDRTPQLLASEDALRAGVFDWLEKTFNASPDLQQQGELTYLNVRDRGRTVSLAQAGQGLAQVLPVATLVRSASGLAAGVDVIEHPTEELHPAAHGAVADLLLAAATRPERPIVTETHSEIVLLRARRWIAEGRLSPGALRVYWVSSDETRGSSLQEIQITNKGDVESWPEGVFYEDYDEVLAIRRAARARP
jgi:hypothetical protein